MRVRLELYASLMGYLPAGANRHATECELPDGSTAHELLDRFGVPRDKAHLVLRNGVFLHAPERDAPLLVDGDVIAVWPPVAGG
ncbi:MAG: MoaD/ThiS family protein [Gammaproteobacteria bacterium]|nr:MoaD/ThiS family protein [Gammaproteobacteria bacterium]MCB1924543.1 MoaD/ThiS family protein [Gammaproteobacteria bacterium]